MPERLVSEVSHAHLEPIIHRAGRSGQTANNDRAAFSWFFSWSIEKRYCASNPALAVTKVKVDNEPEILPLETVRKLISAAAAHKDGVCLPYVVLSLFCAVRPREIERLTWDQIDVESQTVEIGKEQAKKRSRRVVAISDNAMKWLLPHALKRAPLVGPNFRKNFDAVKAAAGFRVWRMGTEEAKGRPEWIPDAMRHTAISYYLAKHADKEKTATWAGNSSDVISEHYLDLVKGKAVEEFWSITPAGGKAKILKLKAA
jgi:integrase